MRRAQIAAVAALIAGLCSPATGQTVQSARATWVGSPSEDYIRLMQLTGAAPLTSRMLRPLESDRELALSDTGGTWRNPWASRFAERRKIGSGPVRFTVYDPSIRLSYNSQLPYGGNDGALWQGRGANASVEGGVSVAVGPVTATLAPNFVYSANRAFELDTLFNPLPTASPWSDRYLSRIIDQPVRFGDRSLRSVGWGQSKIELRKVGVRVSYGTENMWWGPGIENAILMSNNAEGIRHFAVGTDAPANVYIGDLEVLYTLGALDNSDFWRTSIPDSLSKRYVNALMAVLHPKWIPGLYVGGGRLYYAHVPIGGLTFREVRTLFEPLAKFKLVTDSNPGANDKRDQMVTLWARWVFPESQLEIYGELARNDHAANNRDLISEPFHATSRVIGGQKLFPMGAGFIRAGLETADLKKTGTERLRDVPSWYAHHRVVQGYTERGQLLGAAVGPSGDAQLVTADWLDHRGSAGVFIRRWQLNADAYFARYENTLPRPVSREETFFGGGFRGMYSVGPVDITALVSRHTEYNRFTKLYNNVPTWHLELGANWRLR